MDSYLQREGRQLRVDRVETAREQLETLVRESTTNSGVINYSDLTNSSFTIDNGTNSYGISSAYKINLVASIENLINYVNQDNIYSKHLDKLIPSLLAAKRAAEKVDKDVSKSNSNPEF